MTEPKQEQQTTINLFPETHAETEPIKKKGYTAIGQNPAVDDFFKVGTANTEVWESDKNLPGVITATTSDRAKIIIKLERPADTKTGEIEEISEQDIWLALYDVNTLKYFDLFAAALTEKNPYGKEITEISNCTISMNIQEIMKRTGNKITPSNIRKINSKVLTACKKIKRTELHWDSDKRAKLKGRGESSVISEYLVKNGVATITFAPRFANLLLNSYIVYFPDSFLQTEFKSPLYYKIGRKMVEHASNYRNIEKGNSKIISVKTLLKAGQGEIPTKEKVKEEYNSRYIDLINKPLEKALEANKQIIEDGKVKKVGMLKDYYFVRPDKVTIVAQRPELINIEEFEQLFVKVIFEQEPPDIPENYKKRRLDREQKQRRKINKSSKQDKA